MPDPIEAKLLFWGITKTANLLFDQTTTQIKLKLNQNDLEIAIKHGILKAIPCEQALLAKFDDKEIKAFKNAVFQDADVQAELQRPFNNNGKPRVEYLEAGFQKVAQHHKKQLGEAALHPWLRAFSDAYFEKVSAVPFNLAKE